MIPKKIHYVWFGTGPVPEKFQRFIDGWHEKMPDWEFIRWNEHTCPIDGSPHAVESYRAGKLGFTVDYVRFKILYENGGIYLDTDEEVLQSLEPFLTYDAFFGLEPKNRVQAGVVGCVKGHPLIGQILESFKELHFFRPDGTENTEVVGGTHIAYALRQSYGYTPDESRTALLDNGRIAVFPSSYFCPDLMYVERGADNYTIHWPAGSWLPAGRKWKQKVLIRISRIKPLKLLYRLVKR